MMGNIFNKYYLRDYITEYRNNLNNEIDRLEITDSSDIEELIIRLQKRGKIT